MINWTTKIVSENLKGSKLVQQYVELHPWKFLYVTEIKTLFYYDKIHHIYEECEPELKAQIQKDLDEHATPSVVDAIVKKIKEKNPIRMEEIEKTRNKHDIYFRDKIYNLKTKELEDYTEDDIVFHTLPVQPVEELDGFPNIQQWEETTFEGKPEKIALFRSIVGYCFTRHHDLKYFFMFLGSGDNGKSKAINLIEAMIGEKNKVGLSIQELTGKQFTLWHLHNKNANLYADLTKVSVKFADKIKVLTGGSDTIYAERKGVDGFFFVPFAKHVFSANEVPEIDDDVTDAFFSRFEPLEFTAIFSKENADPNILEKITRSNEMDAYAWACLQAYEATMEEKCFSELTTEERRDKWYSYGASTTKYVDECLVEKLGEFLEPAVLSAHYETYCQKNNMIQQSSKRLTEKIRQRYKKAFLGTHRIEPGVEPTHCWRNLGIRELLELDNAPVERVHLVE